MWNKENATDAGLLCWPDQAVELTTGHKGSRHHRAAWVAQLKAHMT